VASNDALDCSPELQNILSRLKCVKRSGKRFMARCPCHDDTVPSLSLSDGHTGVLIRCMAGCELEDVITELGLRWEDIFYDKGRERINRREVAHYNYVDEHGELLYQVVRYYPKTFRIRRPNGDDWQYDGKSVRRVLYNLPRVIKAVESNEIVWIVEGEKDANKATRMGLCATCIAGGSSSPWLDSYSDFLDGAEVALVPDADAPGRTFMWKVARALLFRARSITIIELFPNRDDGADISDWQGTLDDLLVLYYSSVPSSIRLSFSKHDG